MLTLWSRKSGREVRMTDYRTNFERAYYESKAKIDDFFRKLYGDKFLSQRLEPSWNGKRVIRVVLRENNYLSFHDFELERVLRLAAK